MTACPARGERVCPSDSYFGHVTIMPVIVVVGFGPAPFPVMIPPVLPPDAVVTAPVDTSGLAEIGHASRPEVGSTVPARLFDRGWLNISLEFWPVTSPRPPNV